MHTSWMTPQSDNRALLFLDNSGLSWTVSASDKFTAVPVKRNGNFQTPISVPVVRPKRCHTLSNPAHRQDYTVACLNYTLQTMMPLSGWPVMAPNAYDNNNNIALLTAVRLCCYTANAEEWPWVSQHTVHRCTVFVQDCVAFAVSVQWFFDIAAVRGSALAACQPRKCDDCASGSREVSDRAGECFFRLHVFHLYSVTDRVCWLDILRGRSINKLQNGVILFIFEIWKIQNIGFVRNLILNNSCEFCYNDITVASGVTVLDIRNLTTSETYTEQLVHLSIY